MTGPIKSYKSESTFLNSQKRVTTKVWLNNRKKYVFVQSKCENVDCLSAAPLGPVILCIHALRAALTVELVEC